MIEVSQALRTMDLDRKLICLQSLPFKLTHFMYQVSASVSV